MFFNHNAMTRLFNKIIKLLFIVSRTEWSVISIILVVVKIYNLV